MKDMQFESLTTQFARDSEFYFKALGFCKAKSFKANVKIIIANFEKSQFAKLRNFQQLNC